MPTVLNLVFLRHGVTIPDLLRAVQTEVRLFVEGRGAVRVSWYVAVLELETLFCGFCEAGCG